MKIKLILFLLISLLFIIGCDNMKEEKTNDYVDIDEIDISDINSFSFFVENSTYTFSDNKWYVNNKLFVLSNNVWTEEEIKHEYIIQGKLNPLIENIKTHTKGGDDE